MSDIHTSGAAQPVGAYPHAKRVGDLLFLSGIGPRNAQNNTIPGLVTNESGEITDYDIAAQTHAVIANISAVLKAADLELKNLVDIQVFLTDIPRDFKAFNRTYAEYFSEHQPTRTTVEINRLPTPIAVEFKCIAAY